MDWDIIGFLILINDGDFIDKMIYFCNEIDKVYLVCVKGIVIKENFWLLMCGVVIDGKKIKFVCYIIIKVDYEKNCLVVELIIYEGCNY